MKESLPIRVKICGVTTPEDAVLSLEMGADLLGLNFYPESPRAIDLDRAAAIRTAVGDQATLVGVFVNAAEQEIEDADRAAGLDLLQLHGDEGPRANQHRLERSIKAFRLPENGSSSEIEELLRPWQRAWGVLLDTPHESLYGGSGESWDYERASVFGADGPSSKRLFLAGGIGPDNVRRIVERLPFLYALDVCSGVEAEPGRKDPEKLKRLFAEIRHGQTEPTS